jgi:cell cycle sensor histidine kinase DivJ
VGLVSKIVGFVDTLLHPSARRDALSSTRHRAFIGAHLLGAMTLLAGFPIYLVARGTPTPLEVFCCAWLVMPISIAYFLSRTGRYTHAHLMSAVARCTIVSLIALNTGGIESPATIWLLTVPAEAVLSGSRRAILFAVAAVLGSMLLLAGLDLVNWLPTSIVPDQSMPAFRAVSVTALILYCLVLALCAELITHKSRLLRTAEEERYRLLAMNMSDVISRHRRNGTVEFISPAAEVLFGVPLATLHGHGLFDRVHVADRPAFLTAISEAALGGLFRSVEFRVRSEAAADRSDAARPSANFIWIEMRCKPLERSAGTPIPAHAEVVAVLRDVTERKLQEQALNAARAEAEKADAAKGRFLATMSHELRTPLNAIIGFSEMIIQEKELALNADKRMEYARLIHDSGTHLLSVVNGILDMSKMESGNFEIACEPFQPRDAILGCCDLMALKAREGGIDLAVRAADDLPLMLGDRRALKQILLNLLSNAIKFTERGGSVTVSASAAGGNLELKVADTGVGIGAADLERLGDPFFQAGKTYQRRHEGTGLGLSIVKALVGLHEGQLSVDSKIDEGTTISVILPLDLAVAHRPRTSVVTTLNPIRPEKTEFQVKKRA